MKKPANLRKRCVLFGSRGSILVIVALLMPVIIGFAALAIDVGMMYAGKAQQENAVAAASLACQSGISEMQSTPTKPFTQAILYAQKNNVMGVPLSLTTQQMSQMSATSDIQLGKWYNGTFTRSLNSCASNSCNSCQITATVTASSFFGKILGSNSYTKKSVAIAMYGASTKPVNMVLTQDITQSFNSEVHPAPNLGIANKANQILATCVKDRRATGSTIGLTMFSSTATTKLLPTAAMVDAVTGANAIVAAISAMDYDRCLVNGRLVACTNTQAGIVKATASLDNLLKNMTATEKAAALALKDYALTVTTDGAPNLEITIIPPTPTSTAQNNDHIAYKAAQIALGNWPDDSTAATPSPPTYPVGKKGDPPTSRQIDTFNHDWSTYWSDYWSHYCSSPQACAVKAAKAACNKGYKIYVVYYEGNGGASALDAKALSNNPDPANKCNPVLTGQTQSSAAETPFFFKAPAPDDLTSKAANICLDAPTLVYQK